MIIDSTYFTGPLAIAQLGQPAVLNVLNLCIETREEELLLKALGISLYEALTEGLEPASGEDIEERWTKLLEGETFTTTSGMKMKFAGLEKMIPPYVFFHYTRELIIQQAGVGSVQSDVENGKVVTPNFSPYWNSVIDGVNALWQYLSAKADIYPEYDRLEVDGRSFGYGSSLGKINQFGI